MTWHYLNKDEVWILEEMYRRAVKRGVVVRKKEMNKEYSDNNVKSFILQEGWNFPKWIVAHAYGKKLGGCIVIVFQENDREVWYRLLPRDALFLKLYE